MEFLFLLSLILTNGLFVTSETAIIVAKKSRLTALAKLGNESAIAALKLAEHPTQFLSTVGIGITSISIMSGIFGESIVAEPISHILIGYGVNQTLAEHGSMVFSVVLITYLSIVLGELLPKRIALVSPERIACAVAKPIQYIAIITKPAVWLLSGSTRLLMRIFGISQSGNHAVTEDDIHAMLEEGSSTGIIEQQEHDIVRNVLSLEDRSISSLMVPRSEIIFLDTTDTVEQNYETIMQSPHSRFPVCSGWPDETIGIVNTKDLLAKRIKGEAVDLQSMAKEKPCEFVPESMTGLELLQRFKSSHSQMIFISDEYGELKGMVTLQDLLEAMTGEFITKNEQDSYVIQRADGNYLLDGLLPIIDLKDTLGVDFLPNNDQYETLNGLIMFMMGKMPVAGEHIDISGWHFEVVDMDGRRVDKVLATKLAQ
jgi:putative hemolysin